MAWSSYDPLGWVAGCPNNTGFSQQEWAAEWLQGNILPQNASYNLSKRLK